MHLIRSNLTNFRDTKDGVIVSVKVIPRASKDEITGWQDDRLKIKVCAPAEKSKANLAVIRLLSQVFKLPQSRIILLKGATVREKDFLLAGCSSVEIECLLAELLR